MENLIGQNIEFRFFISRRNCSITVKQYKFEGYKNYSDSKKSNTYYDAETLKKIAEAMKLIGQKREKDWWS